jgi:hypothetical protein
MLKTYTARRIESYNPPYTLPPAGAQITGIYATFLKPDKTRVPVRIIAPLPNQENIPPALKDWYVTALNPSATPFLCERAQLVFVQVFAIIGGR